MQISLTVSDFFEQYWPYLAIGVAALACLVILLAFLLHFLVRARRNRKNERESLKKVTRMADELPARFGGRDNILGIATKGSRVEVEVKSSEGIKADELEKEGLHGAIVMSDKVVFPVGVKADEFARMIEDRLRTK